MNDYKFVQELKKIKPYAKICLLVHLTMAIYILRAFSHS